MSLIEQYYASLGSPNEPYYHGDDEENEEENDRPLNPIEYQILLEQVYSDF